MLFDKCYCQKNLKHFQNKKNIDIVFKWTSQVLSFIGSKLNSSFAIKSETIYYKILQEEYDSLINVYLQEQQQQQQRQVSESLMKKAPWSAVATQAMQAVGRDGLTLAEIQRLEREKKLEQMKEQQQMMQIIAQQQAAALAREQVSRTICDVIFLRYVIIKKTVQ